VIEQSIIPPIKTGAPKSAHAAAQGPDGKSPRAMPQPPIADKSAPSFMSPSDGCAQNLSINLRLVIRKEIIEVAQQQ